MFVYPSSLGKVAVLEITENGAGGPYEKPIDLGQSLYDIFQHARFFWNGGPLSPDTVLDSHLLRSTLTHPIHVYPSMLQWCYDIL